MNSVPSVVDQPLSWPAIRLLRPRQWIKNAFVLAPLIFSGSFVRLDAVIEALAATALFCVAASAVYVFNDLHDRDADRRHPRKRHTRPLAAGVVTEPNSEHLCGARCRALHGMVPHRVLTLCNSSSLAARNILLQPLRLRALQL